MAENSEIKISAEFNELCDTLNQIEAKVADVIKIYVNAFSQYSEFYTGGGAYALDNYATQVQIHLKELQDLYNKISIYFNYANQKLQEQDQELSQSLNLLQQSEGD